MRNDRGMVQQPKLRAHVRRLSSLRTGNIIAVPRLGLSRRVLLHL
jgi:hypothetical protein